MGVDIIVCRLKKVDKIDIFNDNYVELLDEETLEYDNKGLAEWTKEYETDLEMDCFNWKKYKEETGIDVHEYIWKREELNDNDEHIAFLAKNDNDKPEDYIKIELDKVPQYKKTIKAICYDQVGYQRNGLNDLFYDDIESGKLKYFVCTKEELLRYKDLYCNTDYTKTNFQENIIDKFEEGKDAVAFSW